MTYFVDLARNDGSRVWTIVVRASSHQAAKLEAVKRLEREGEKPTDWQFVAIEEQ